MKCDPHGRQIRVEIVDFADFRAVERFDARMFVSPCPFCGKREELAWDSWGTGRQTRLTYPNHYILFECLACGAVNAKHWVKRGFIS
jgi:predicted RNA-binding Zn-ribbon protein involved in translation (DUF1610 family)